jgi:hypothetical protein
MVAVHVVVSEVVVAMAVSVRVYGNETTEVGASRTR